MRHLVGRRIKIGKELTGGGYSPSKAPPPAPLPAHRLDTLLGIRHGQRRDTRRDGRGGRNRRLQSQGAEGRRRPIRQG